MWQTQKLGSLVKGLARGIVDRAAQPAECLRPGDDQELAMAARDQKHKVGKRQSVSQARGQGVARQMVDPDKRQSCCRRQPLGTHDARQHAADQPRSRSYRDGIQISKGKPGFGQSLFHTQVQPFHMRARGKFRHNPAEGRVKGRLRMDDRAQDFRRHAGAMTYDCGGGIIATAFQSKKGQGAVHLVPIARVIPRR